MAIDLYWGSNSAYCWRVLLALEHKGLEYRSHLLKFDQQEHKAPQMLAMNPRGQLPVLRDGDYVVFESVGVLYYLDRKYPEPPIFGRTPEEGGVIMRVICEYQAYAEPSLMQIVSNMLYRREPALGDARALADGPWILGEKFSAADMVIYPDIRLLLRALQRQEARELAARFLPMDINYPSLARWLERVAVIAPKAAHEPVA